MDRSSRQRINKATEILNDTIEQLDLIDIFRTLYQKKPHRIYILFKHTCTFSRIDHVLGHKRHFSKFKSIKIILGIFSDHSGMKLEINHSKRNGEEKKENQ